MDREKGRAVFQSFLRERDRLDSVEERIEATLNAYVTEERNPYPRDWVMFFRCRRYDLLGAGMLNVEGIWSSGYMGDDGERAVVEVPVEVLAPLADGDEGGSR